MTDQPRPTREEVALTEVGQTTIAPATAWALVLAFLAIIAVVPLVDGLAQWRAGGSFAAVPAFDLVRHPPALAEFAFPVHRQAASERNPLHRSEHAVEDASLLKQTVQPLAQSLLSGIGRTGNSKVVRGVDDWLFYRPGIDYLAGPGFLGAVHDRILPRRNPDPRPAILAFHQACAAAGARLIVVPMPDKAMIHPEKLTPGAVGSQPQNPDYAAFIADLGKAGIDTFDAAPTLRAEKLAHGGAFLRQDTHWTPEAMDAVARALAAAVAGSLPPPARARSFTTAALGVERIGDLVDTLKLPADQRLFAPERRAIAQVRDESAKPWQPTTGADLLLLGDSFTNIYSAAAMGWGESAGFAAHLALRLHRDLDVIAINGGGASGTRAALARRAAPLAGVKLVVWQFSVRDLAVEEWPVIPLNARAAAPTSLKPGSGDLVIDATVSVLSRVERPGTVPYHDALTTIKATVDGVVSGAYAGKEILLVGLCMQKDQLLPIATLRLGQKIRVAVVPWAEREAKFGTIKRYDDTDETVLDQFWVEGWREPK